ncbi:hypothetical protein JI435_415880 [Parastagonospora nodorum SN15]|uniref:Uncharacterized protein n=1 Tax=Phaeosphaeria nodorum (strain SN15 / ATCC MYA-4574 / FGSC 10173) TaxID=321614 RepID=A0A7U2FD41_PHANO|nr:hypothetical protein JI435_415880 [Parastagonospora nodorum SN15]
MRWYPNVQASTCAEPIDDHDMLPLKRPTLNPTHTKEKEGRETRKRLHFFSSCRVPRNPRHGTGGS